MGLNYNRLSKKIKKQVQTIQNSALRIIFKKNREQNTKELHELANIEKINVRMKKLNDQYLEKCEAYENPLIENLVADHIKREIEGHT